MKQCCILFGIIVLFPVVLFCQSRSVGMLSGLVTSESNNQPLEFVNVVLFDRVDSALVSGAVTDKKGKFEIGSIPFGEYYLKYSLLGYKESRSAPFTIDSRHEEISLGTVSLIETPLALDEVAVTSSRITLNTSIDRKVYNVESDIMSKTGSASELLQNIPSIQVDIDGNVSLRGSTNVLILLNGKPSPLLGSNRAEVLEQMPANSIEKIEVITNPSAKYKPDGTSGIINIVLKKAVNTGLNGNVSGNVGNNRRYNAAVNFTYNPGTFDVFGSYGIRQDDRNSFTTDTREQRDSASTPPSSYKEDLKSFSRPLSHLVTLGLEYSPDKINSAGISGNYRYRSFTRNETSSKIIRDSISTVVDDYDRVRLDYEYQNEGGMNAYFQHNFSGKDHKLRIEFNIDDSPEQEDNHYTNIYRTPVQVNELDNTLIKQNDSKTQIAIDYTNPISEHTSLEAGYAGEINKGDFDYFGEFYDTPQQQFVKDIQKTNHFIFDETIHAVYATYENSSGPFSYLGGVRAEEALLKSNLVTRDSIILNNYFNIYPTLHLAYKFSDAAELQLNYSRRVNRPESEDLNPFPEYRDPRNIRSGNPRLKPEYIHSIEFGYQWQNDKITVVPSIFYRNKYNGFASVTEAINDSTLLTTKTNLSSDQSAGFEVVISGSSGNFFSTNLSANAFYEQIDASNLGFSNNKSTITWSGNASCNLNFASATMIQVNSNYRSSRLTPQGEYRPSFVLNLGIRQDLFNEKISAILTASDILKTLDRKTDVNTYWMHQYVVNTRDSRIFYFGLTYHFGEPAKKSKEKPLQYDNGL